MFVALEAARLRSSSGCFGPHTLEANDELEVAQRIYPDWAEVSNIRRLIEKRQDAP
jgi:hypothetical protein